MSSVIDFVLDGLERALELERELGVRSVECDRSLLVERRETSDVRPVAPPSDRIPPPRPQSQPPRPQSPIANPQSPVSKQQSPIPNPSSPRGLVFLHDRPLSAQGAEMMAKIVTAMGLTAENAPIVVAPPVPKTAKVIVVLGGRAMKLYYPEMKGGPGQWLKSPEGQEVLVTYSPEYILRFDTVTPAVQKLKKDMWHSLKAVVQRMG